MYELIIIFFCIFAFYYIRKGANYCDNGLVAEDETYILDEENQVSGIL